MASQLEQHNNAEYAALTALRVAVDTNQNAVVSSRISQAIAQAEKIAGENRYLGNRNTSQVLTNELRDKKAGTVTFGHWDRQLRVFTEEGRCIAGGQTRANAVRVALKTRTSEGSRPSSKLKAIFSSIFGYTDFDSRAWAIAYWDEVRDLYSLAGPDAQIVSRDRLDVNGDRVINSADATAITNYLNSTGSGPAGALACYDTNNDNFISSIDTLFVINYLNRR